MTKSEQCQCAIHRDQLDFQLDDFLIEKISAGRAIIFAGAGISTESRIAAPHSLATELAVELGLDGVRQPFPDLAEAVAAKPDGRFKLLSIIQKRFDYIERFRQLKTFATRFHTELATMPYLSTFITTNWDRHFEECCSAKPFVYDQDMRFWDLPYRRVLKVHGTIDDYSSIVATRSDYDECQRRLHKSLVGSKLKDILATRTCLFIGYSLRDDDIQEVFSFVRDALGKFPKTHYFVSPQEPESSLPQHVRHIRTDGTFFLQAVKEHMCATACYMPDEAYEHVHNELSKVLNDHHQLYDQHDANEHPQIILAAAYQDGLIHAYTRIIDGRSSGRFSDLHDLQGHVMSYSDKIASYQKERSYIDVAYFRGYQNALIGFATLAIRPHEFPPHFYFEKVGEMDAEEYDQVFHDLPTIHRRAFAYCQKLLKQWNLAPGVVMQHMPWG